MILVIGGRGAGKRSFVTDVLGFSPEQFAENGPVLYGLEELDPLPPLEALLGRAVVVCREVGCGVVPMDRGDRDWRGGGGPPVLRPGPGGGGRLPPPVRPGYAPEVTDAVK